MLTDEHKIEAGKYDRSEFARELAEAKSMTMTDSDAYRYLWHRLAAESMKRQKEAIEIKKKEALKNQ